MNEKITGIARHTQSSKRELTEREKFVELIRDTLISEEKLIWQMSLFLNRQSLTRMICIQEIYQKILDVHGVIMEFGVYFGRDLILLQNLRGIYEPSNYTRKVIGFDTFGGLPKLSDKDGGHAIKGDFGVPKGYVEYLEKLMLYHEQESYLNQIKKFELVKGDVCDTLPKYLERNPETVIALAYLDMDLYEPTKCVLELIEPYLVKGSIVVFDELNFHAFPGETEAFRELGFNRFRLYGFPIDPTISYVVYGEKNDK